jgi:hypothetical protein
MKRNHFIQRLSGQTRIIAWILTFFVSILNHSANAQSDSLPLKRFRMTSYAFGGVSVLGTNVNNQFTVMTGGRGAATFNNRYTFGGAGWGMPKGIELENYQTGTYNFFKFGYGGLEFGYVFFNGDKIKFGTNLLVALGIGFKETVPKAKSQILSFFPLFEPSVYGQIPVGKLFRLELGVKYRYVTATHMSYMSDAKLCGASVFVAFLIGKCTCK